MREYTSGVITGTGSAITVQCGFIPDYVRAVNITDGTRVDEWFAAMDDGTSIAVVAAAGPTLNAADGITPYAGTSGGDSAGFVIGSDISISAKKIAWIAWRT